MALQPDDDPSLRRILAGHLTFRVNDGDLIATPFYLDVSRTRVRLRYGDGVNHDGACGDDVVAFFNGLVPSLELAEVS